MWNWLRRIFGQEQELANSGGGVPEAALEVSRSLPQGIHAAARSSWRPVVSEAEAAEPLSRFGGREACLCEGERWPSCENCAEPLHLFVQISSRELPPEAEQPFGEGILQVFYCVSSDPLCEVEAEAWGPFSGSVVARIVPLETPTSVGEHEKAFRMRRIVGWELNVDYPGWEELPRLGIRLTDEEEDAVGELGYPLEGDKLLGWPRWVQGPEPPSCQTCGDRMQVIFQIDSEDNVPHMFGDMGIGHLSQCKQHREVVAFGWACH